MNQDEQDKIDASFDILEKFCLGSMVTVVYIWIFVVGFLLLQLQSTD
jgi:hypothetical protein